MSEEKIYIGLDIGTDSVGFAATNQNYVLKKFRGEPVWGATLFEGANLKTERRSFRTARRRLDRRKQRVALIQGLFAEEIEKVDPCFYIRLKESGLYRDEAECPYAIFNDKGFTDKEYHIKYPTIHHLISELMNSDEPHDVRLVYLACAWLVAHRGHFLSEISKENISALTDFSTVYNNLVEYFVNNDYDLPWGNANSDVIEKILKKKISSTAKYSELSLGVFNNKKSPKEPFEKFPFNCEAVFQSICGRSVKAKDIFLNTEYGEISSFTLGDDDKKLGEVIAALSDEDGELIRRLKAVYDWSLLVDSLKNKKSISDAKVEIYENHKHDLEQFKMLVKKYLPEKYSEVFRKDKKDNYRSYIKSTQFNDAFCAYAKKLIDSIEPDEEDIELCNEIKEKIALGTFLPKQRNTDNRVIPYQLYWYELKAILDKAEAYLGFLKRTDCNGLTTKEKIMSVFTFRIPYFVGPLNARSPYAWVERKSEKIYPWNFDKIVDLDASEQNFISKMTNKCTYLPEETVIPKESLLYHKFTVLNEINNIKIDDVPISVELKQQIYNDLFCSFKKVSRKKIEDYLRSENYLASGQTLSGTDIQINSNLKSYHDFKKLLANGKLTERNVEDIILRLTYSEDKIRFSKWLKENYSFLSESDIRYISRLNYKDFGRLSAKFLSDFQGVDNETKEAYTIIEALWKTNNNLMMLLSEKFTFAENIKNVCADYYSAHPKRIEERLDDMYISNAVKRPIIRSLEIVKEIEKAVGKAPSKIFIEMPRGATAEQKNKRTTARRLQIAELYKKFRDEEVRHLEKQLEDMGELADNNLQSDRLFLYFMQLGRCMYSGDPIDITQLKGATYNIEHIYPRSLVKDDSIVNNKILVKSEINGAKSDIYPVPAEIRLKMQPLWSVMKANGLISEEKYKRLTRKMPFTDDEKFGFINRQLTETSQSTKAVATLLKERYPDTEIVYVKARLSSEFRQEFGCLKSRTFNDLHHAKDAYLNIVTGNVYNEKFTKSKGFDIHSNYNIQAKKIFTKDFIRGKEVIWKADEMLEYVKKTVAKNNAHMTRYALCKHSGQNGGFYDQMPKNKEEGVYPRKKNLPVKKYGGYRGGTISFFMLVKYKIGKKTDVMIMPVELLYADEAVKNAESAANYAKTRIGKIIGKATDEVSFPLGLRKIKINTTLSLDGFKICITGSSSKGKCIIAMPFMPFAADNDINLYMKNLESFNEKCNENPGFVYKQEYDKVSPEENIKLYDMYIDKLQNSIYKKRPNNPLKILLDGRDKFIALDIKEQASALLSIHQVFGRTADGCCLKLIGGAERAAATNSFSSNISNWKKQYSEVRIIDCSTTGLWEKASDNLLDLI